MKFELRFNIHAKRTGVCKSNEGSDQGGEIVAECLPVSRTVSIIRSTSVSGLSAVCTYQTEGWAVRSLALTHFLETLLNTLKMHWSMYSVPQLDFITSVFTFFPVCFLFALVLLSFLFSVLRFLSQLSSVRLCTKNGCYGEELVHVFPTGRYNTVNRLTAGYNDSVPQGYIDLHHVSHLHPNCKRRGR